MDSNKTGFGDRKRPAVSVESSPMAKKGRADTDRNFDVKPLMRRTIEIRCNDNVHRSIDVCPVMRAVMDTWPVQRLRDIKQLGTTYLVYPAGDHSRFEHSLGVAYAAQDKCRRLQTKYQSAGVTNKDVLCLNLAGLLHDLGHGPFSHLYEVFREDVNAELERFPEKRELYAQFPIVPTKWSHERSSLMMVDEVLKDLGLKIDMDRENLDKPLMQIGDGIAADSMRCYDSNGDDKKEILTNRDWIFIKECIYGKPIPGLNERIGRTGPIVEWLYEIVSNSRTGIDVDKMDYFARDQRRTLNEAGNMDLFISKEACVARGPCADSDCQRCKTGELHYQICYPKKCVTSVIEFFKTRAKLHETIYQHKTTCAAACMVNDILKKADPYFLLPTGDPKVNLPISRAFNDPFAFERLRDSIIEQIASSTTPELQPARDLARRFQRRILYKLSSEKVLHIEKNEKHAALWLKAKKFPEKVVREIVCDPTPRHGANDTGIVTELTEDDVVIVCSSWHHGQKDKNPLNFVRFIEKDSAGDMCEIAKLVDPEDYDMFTTKAFQKNVIRVFCRDPSKAKKDLLSHAFEAYWDKIVSGYSRPASPTPAVNVQMRYGDEEHSDSSDEESHTGGNGFPNQLTQDSGDEGDLGTPRKLPSGSLQFASPSPVPVRKI